MLRITNSELYGNEYKLTNYMIDLRNAIFKDDMNSNISTVRQNLQVTYIKKLISMINEKSPFHNIAQSSAYYNIKWLENNINMNTGDLSSRQHKQYIIYLLDSIDD